MTIKERIYILYKIVSNLYEYRCETNEGVCNILINKVKELAAEYFEPEILNVIMKDGDLEFIDQIEHFAFEFLEYQISNLPSHL